MRNQALPGESARRQYSRARTSLLWGLGSFVCLQLGLAVAIEVCLPEFRAPYYAPKAARLEQRLREVSGPEPGMMRSILERLPFFHPAWPQPARQAKVILA